MRFEISLKRDESVFDNIKGISKNYARMKQKMLFLTIISLFSGWKNRIKEDENTYTFFEEGDKEYIEKEKIKWEKFFLGSADDLYKEGQNNKITKVFHDRGVKQILNKIKYVPSNLSKKLVHKVLDDGNVAMLFVKMGILVIWEIEN